MKHTPESELYSTRRVAIAEGDPAAAEMLHTFFRLMELDASLVDPSDDPLATIRRLAPDVVILDLDCPELHAVEIAEELRGRIGVILETAGELPASAPEGVSVIRKPQPQFEELLRLMELVLEVGVG